MKISTKGRYALRIMIDLAQNSSGEFIHLKDVSRRQGISIKYMEQIMPYLTRSGFIRSSRGNTGGYRLTRDPKDYTAGEILRSAEGNLCPVSCLEDQPVLCPRADICPSLSFWKGLDKVISDYVDHVTLKELAFPEEKDEG